MAVAHVLGLEVQLTPQAALSGTTHPQDGEWIPARIALADYPQLASLAWQVQGVDTLTPVEAFDIYERNGRHLDTAVITAKESALMSALNIAFGTRKNHVSP